LGDSDDVEGETYCKICGCKKAQAWPRVGSTILFREEGYFLTSKKLSRGINAGCRACLLLKKGIEHFQTLQLDEEEVSADNSRNEYFVIYRQQDGGWIVSLPKTNPTVVLEFTKSIGIRKSCSP
jgi:hypothetical protein